MEKYEEAETDESEEERIADELDDLMMAGSEDCEEDGKRVVDGSVDNKTTPEESIPTRSTRLQRKARLSVITYKEDASDGDSDDAWSMSDVGEEDEEDSDLTNKSECVIHPFIKNKNTCVVLPFWFIR